MTAQVTKFKAAGVKAIAADRRARRRPRRSPRRQAQGLDVPILGNNPVFAPGLLARPGRRRG